MAKHHQWIDWNLWWLTWERHEIQKLLAISPVSKCMSGSVSSLSLDRICISTQVHRIQPWVPVPLDPAVLHPVTTKAKMDHGHFPPKIITWVLLVSTTMVICLPNIRPSLIRSYPDVHFTLSHCKRDLGKLGCKSIRVRISLTMDNSSTRRNPYTGIMDRWPIRFGACCLGYWPKNAWLTEFISHYLWHERLVWQEKWRGPWNKNMKCT